MRWLSRGLVVVVMVLLSWSRACCGCGLGMLWFAGAGLAVLACVLVRLKCLLGVSSQSRIELEKQAQPYPQNIRSLSNVLTLPGQGRFSEGQAELFLCTSALQAWLCGMTGFGQTAQPLLARTSRLVMQ